MRHGKKTTQTEMKFIDHLKELRFRLFVSLIAITIGSVVAFILYNHIINILLFPLRNITSSVTGKTLFLNTIYEGFLVRIKVSFIVGIILSLPVHLYNFIKFVFPGLKPSEKKIIIYSLWGSFFLIIFSIYYGYFKIIPVSIKFFTSSGFVPDKVGLILNFNKNVFYVLQFLLVSLLIFQLPLILFLLLYFNLIKRKTVLKFSRYVIVGIFILSAIVTPPDVLSQIAFALPLVALFFLVILLAKIFKLGE